MELEIMHLAPYLPYGLKMQYVVREKVEKTGVLQSISHRDFETHPTRVSIEGLYNEEHIWMFKPILRPLSDLNKEMSVFTHVFVPKNILSDSLQMQLDIWNLPEIVDLKVTDYQKLLGWHFDIFGLIKNGLAVDINTLSF
jgi:hypothetical protein